MTSKRIGTIQNYYSDLSVYEYDAKFYWQLNNYDGVSTQEIPKILYDTLIAFENGELCNKDQSNE